MCCELERLLFGCLLNNTLYLGMNMIEVLFVLYDMLCSITKLVVKLGLNNVHTTCALFWIAW